VRLWNGQLLYTSPISYLIQVAEEQKEQARRDLELGELNAEERFRDWSKMLDTLHRLRDRGSREALESITSFPSC
jgi:hypothetical protein